MLENDMLENELARIEDEYVAAGYDREAAATYRALMGAHAAAFERLYGFDAASTLRAVNIERADAAALNHAALQADEALRRDNGQKFERWARDAGVQFPFVSPNYGPANAHGNTIYTEADLVKLRSENPTLYQPVFHGGPTRGIERMSTDFIGMGEGNQSFGWGLYFAEDKETAEDYRISLSGASSESFQFNGNSYSRQDNPAEYHALSLAYYSGVKTAIKDLKRWREEDAQDEREGKLRGKSDEYYSRALALLEKVTSKKDIKIFRGQLYEVDIPDNDELLDWDKPLSEQSEHVKSALRYVADTSADVLLRKRQQPWISPIVRRALSEDWRGSYLMRELQLSQLASEALNSIGIPGLRYLDGSSRSQGEGSHNFVIWNDKSVEILNTFYQGIESNPDAVGAITPEMAARIGLRPGAIILKEESLVHIEQKHGEQIRKLGFVDAREFINDVLSNVDAIYQGNTGRAFDFVADTGDTKRRVLAKLEFEQEGDKYVIKTAGLIRDKFYKNKSPLWEAAPTSSPEETPSAARRASQRGQSGERLNLTTALEQVKRQGRGARGSVSFMSGGRSIIRIFASADLSTPIHEGAHVFINDLTRVVEDNGLRARLLFEREIAAIPANIDDRERERRRGDIGARYRRHMRGLERAKADMRALRENADEQREAHGKAVGRVFEKVPPEGPLTPGQYRTLQEVNAAAFEHYLLTDNAPPPKVEGIFSRMKAWLAGVYEAAKTAAASAVAGVCVTPEAREVFDRLLSAPDGDEDEESAACPAP